MKFGKWAIFVHFSKFIRALRAVVPASCGPLRISFVTLGFWGAAATAFGLGRLLPRGAAETVPGDVSGRPAG